MERIEIVSERHIFNRRFQIDSFEFTMKFRETAFLPNTRNILNAREQNIIERFYIECFNELLNYIEVVLDTSPRDFVGMKFQVETIGDARPFGLHFRELREYSSEIITDLFLRLQQSNDDFRSHDAVSVTITIVKNQSGGTTIPLTRLPIDDFEILCKRKKQTILIPKRKYDLTDKKCLPRALLIGQYYVDCYQDRRQMNKLFDLRSKILEKNVDKLCRQIFGSIKKYEEQCLEGCTMTEITKFSKYFRNYQITVWNDLLLYKEPMFRNKKQTKKQINLFFLTEKQHFITLSNVCGFFGVRFHCQLCDRLLFTKRHRCSERCNRCFFSPPCYFNKKDNDSENEHLCTICNRMFKNDFYYENHLKKELIKITKNKNEEWSVCERYKICQKCFKFYDCLDIHRKNKNIPIEHKCEEKYCTYCKMYVFLNHNCNIQTYNSKMLDKFVIFFYDLETVQNKPVSLIKANQDETQFLHEPILLCSQQICNLCWKIESIDYQCKQCKIRSKTFEGKDCVSEFKTYLLNATTNKKLSQIRCIAHNARGFDAQFMIKEILKTNGHRIRLQMQGYKILYIEIKGFIKFIDSLYFLPMKLDNFPKAFDLSAELNKGFFPYLFLSFDNWSYIGDIPEKHFFGFNCDDTVTERIQNFNLWYDKVSLQSKKEYNLRDEAIRYCSNDVSLLRLGCLKFISMIIDLFEINPYFQCLTLAQLALTIFRKKCMPSNMLGIVPSDNYHSNINHSQICKKWLIYLNYFQFDENQAGPSNKDFSNSFIKSEVRLLDCGISVDGFCKNYPFKSSFSEIDDIFENSSWVINNNGNTMHCEGSTLKANSEKGTVFEFSGCYFHGCPECLKTNSYRKKRHIFNKNKKPDKDGNLIYNDTVLNQEKIDRNLLSLW